MKKIYRLVKLWIKQADRDFLRLDDHARREIINFINESTF